jgi:hypothetical protein
MAEFCVCGSLKIDGKCTNRKKNCEYGTNNKKAVDFRKQGYVRHKKTGALIDKETGTAVYSR